LTQTMIFTVDTQKGELMSDDAISRQAAKHGYWSEHWDISIRRTYKGDFYCADAEPKGEQE
jgi:hypothetical protein